jgi:hypothetical protein
MRHLYLAALVVLAAMTTPGAAEKTSSDREALLEHLNASSTQFADSIRDLTPEQWNHKPAGGGWSIAECAEHIVLTEGLLRGMVTDKVLSAAPSAERAAGRRGLDQQVLDMITDRSRKAQAPEPLQPSGKFSSAEVALKQFEIERKQTIHVAKSAQDLRAHATPHFVFKELDAHQWLLYLSGHTMRHTAQIQEVKNSPGFPRAK